MSDISIKLIITAINNRIKPKAIANGKFPIEVSKAIEVLKNDKIFPGHFDMRFVKPLDTNLLHKILKKYKNIVTVEDGCILGGFGSAILEFMANNDYKNNIVRLGIPDKIIEHGSQDELYTECNFDTEGIIKASKKILKK